MKTLIKNGRIVTAVDDYRADILIKDEQVSLIGDSKATPPTVILNWTADLRK